MLSSYKKGIDYLAVIAIVLLIISSLTDDLSINFTKSYDTLNQYGQNIRMYGYGIYSNDSYFKAPILIGSDICILFVLVPMFIITLYRDIKEQSYRTKLSLISVYATSLYYATSVSFGVTYNRLHLVYIALFSCTLFGMFFALEKIKFKEHIFIPTKGINVFLILSGIALIVAWMPDIIPTLFTGRPITLIEVYTTEITYVIDMGIVGPLCILCLILLKRKNSLGIVILAALLKLCMIIGIMMIPQTIVQLMSGYELALLVIITKSGSFVLLGLFAYIFNKRLYKSIVLAGSTK